MKSTAMTWIYSDGWCLEQECWVSKVTKLQAFQLKIEFEISRTPTSLKNKKAKKNLKDLSPE